MFSSAPFLVLLMVVWIIMHLEYPIFATETELSDTEQYFSLQNCLIVFNQFMAPSAIPSKQPQNITMPPPCFSVGTVCFSLNASFFIMCKNRLANVTSKVILHFGGFQSFSSIVLYGAHCCSMSYQWCNLTLIYLNHVSQLSMSLFLPFTLSSCSVWGQTSSCGHVQGGWLESHGL